jgi:hypothetical protein
MKYLMLLLGLGCLLLVAVHMTKRDVEKAADGQGSGLDKAKGAALEIQLKVISDALDLYREDSHCFPENLESLVPRYLPSENDLVDPWGIRMALRRDVRQDLILVSAGRDRIFDSPDDAKKRIE